MWQKIAVLLAGAVMNVITALLVMIIAVTVSGIPTNTLDSVVKNSPAEAAGLRAGDRVVAVNEVKTSGWMEVVQEIDRDKSGKFGLRWTGMARNRIAPFSRNTPRKRNE